MNEGEAQRTNYEGADGTGMPEEESKGGAAAQQEEETKEEVPQPKKKKNKGLSAFMDDASEMKAYTATQNE